MKKQKFLNIILIALLTSFCLMVQNTFAEDQLVKTPADYEGPFYPVTSQQDIDNDLIQIKGQTGVAAGDILNLTGKVMSTRGEPRAGVIIEIWQTDPQGRYKHPGDSTPGERDPHFQYWGAAITDTDGTFFFRTLIPGAYNPRPAHIHYKVLQDGKTMLTSQIYFIGTDERKKIPSMTSQIELQTIDLKPTATGEFEAFFRIVL
ncbi:MAG: protocatechuate 3,4-dioxygenase [Thermodesulfobacteriota bacterium]